MKNIIFHLLNILLLVSTPLAFGQPVPQSQVTLLTSFDPSPPQIPSEIPQLVANYLRSYILHRPRTLESQFIDFFRSYPEVHPKIIHEATQEDAWRELHDPANLGVFWVSHAAGSDADPLVGGTIFDSRGFSIGEIFQDAHPNLRILALVGCGSSQWFERMPSNQFLHRDRFPNLRIFAGPQNISAEEGLGQALEQTRFGILERTDLPATNNFHLQSQNSPRSTTILLFKRKLILGSQEYFYPALRITTSHGRVLGVFRSSNSQYPNAALRPDGYLEQTSLVEIPMPAHFISSSPDLSGFDLFVSSGLNSRWKTELYDLGEFEIEPVTPIPGYWHLLVNRRTRAAIGRETHVFRFQHL